MRVSTYLDLLNPSFLLPILIDFFYIVNVGKEGLEEEIKGDQEVVIDEEIEGDEETDLMEQKFELNLGFDSLPTESEKDEGDDLLRMSRFDPFLEFEFGFQTELMKIEMNSIQENQDLKSDGLNLNFEDQIQIEGDHPSEIKVLEAHQPQSTTDYDEVQGMEALKDQTIRVDHPKLKSRTPTSKPNPKVLTQTINPRSRSSPLADHQFGSSALFELEFEVKLGHQIKLDHHSQILQHPSLFFNQVKLDELELKPELQNHTSPNQVLDHPSLEIDRDLKPELRDETEDSRVDSSRKYPRRLSGTEDRIDQLIHSPRLFSRSNQVEAFVTGGTPNPSPSQLDEMKEKPRVYSASKNALMELRKRRIERKLAEEEREMKKRVNSKKGSEEVEVEKKKKEEEVKGEDDENEGEGEEIAIYFDTRRKKKNRKPEGKELIMEEKREEEEPMLVSQGESLSSIERSSMGKKQKSWGIQHLISLDSIQSSNSKALIPPPRPKSLNRFDQHLLNSHQRVLKPRLMMRGLSSRDP